MTPEPVLSVPDSVPPESSRIGFMLSVPDPVLSSPWNWFWNQFYVKLLEQVLAQIQFQVKPDLVNFVTLLYICKILIIFIKFRPRTGTDFSTNSVPGEARLA